MFKKILASILFLFLFSVGFASEKIVIGADIAPPYVLSKSEGLLPEIIEYINRKQDDFKFELEITALNDRYQAIRSGDINLYMFDSIYFGWIHYKAASSSSIFNEKIVPVTLKQGNITSSEVVNLVKKNKVVSHNVGLIKGNNYDVEIKSTLIVESDSYADLLGKLDRNTCDVVFMPETVAEYLIANSYDPEVYDLGQSIKDYDATIIVGHSVIKSKTKIEDTFIKYFSSLRYEKLARKYGLIE